MNSRCGGLKSGGRGGQAYVCNVRSMEEIWVGRWVGLHEEENFAPASMSCVMYLPGVRCEGLTNRIKFTSISTRPLPCFRCADECVPLVSESGT